jgi:CBS domain-containing protein
MVSYCTGEFPRDAEQTFSQGDPRANYRRVSSVGRSGASFDMEDNVTTASDIMTRDVITVTPETTLREVARIFSEKKINGLPVVDDDGNVLGVVCESDLVSQNKPLHIPTVFVILDSVIPLENPWRLERDFKRFTATTVKDIYSKPAITVGPETDISEVARIMSKNKIYTIPVLEHGKLAGVIGKIDIIKAVM